MVAPLAPTPLTPPDNSYLSGATDITLIHNHPGGETARRLKTRRQVASYPTPGGFEWYRSRSMLVANINGIATVPDAPSLHINGNITITIYLKLADYTPSSNQWLFQTGGAGSGYLAVLDTLGGLTFEIGNSSNQGAFASSSPGLSDGVGYWLEFAYNATSKTGTFRKSTNSPETPIASIAWTTLFTTPAHAGVGGISDSNAPIYIGSAATGTSRITGSMSRFNIKNSAGIEALDLNFGLATPGAISHTQRSVGGFTHTITVSNGYGFFPDASETLWSSEEAFSGINVPANDIITQHVGAFSNGFSYYWACAVAGDDGIFGPYSRQRALTGQAAPTPEIILPSGAQSSPFFQISWSWNSPSGRLQRDYRFWVYTNDVYGQSGFDPSSAEWQARAQWGMPRKVISSSEFYYDVTDWSADPNTIYKVYGEFHDTDGVSSGYISGPIVTLNTNTIAAPSISTDVDEETGKVTMIISGSYNLMGDANSDFVGQDIGDWINVLNANLTYEPTRSFSPPGSLKVTSAGMTFGALDTLLTTFAAEDAAYTTFGAAQSVQQAPVGTVRVRSGGLIPVTASAQYSALANCSALYGSQQGHATLYWWKADTSASTTPTSSGVNANLPINVWTELRVTATSPADAAYVTVGVEIGSSAAVGSEFLIDAVVVRPGATVDWIKSAGVAYRYAGRRTESDGTVYDIPGATIDDPFTPPGGQNVARIVDLDPPINHGPFFYELWAIQGQRPNDLWSPVGVVEVDSMSSKTWFIKTADGTLEAPLNSEVRSLRVSVDSDVQQPSGSSVPTVLFSSAPDVEEWSLSAWVLDIDAYNNLAAILNSKDDLIIQTNLHGERIYGTVVGGWGDSQHRAMAIVDGQPVRPVRSLDFKVVSTGRVG